MSKASWAWAGTAALVVPAAVGAGLWLGGGPATREGWEAAAWAAGITAALWLVATAVAWALTPAPPPSGRPAPSGAEGAPDVTNTVRGNISGGTVAQGENVRLEQRPSYGGDHIDLSEGTFHGTVIGKQNTTPAPDDDPDIHRPEC